ncbi:phosphatase PAP2 family protein [Tsukamurella asaccharolytica]|uniref:Phosphatase PAP2 family protein n=1 Tax=Tsukamurella asaccharolytica TaxID=2592067 RepID=A0A5C5R7Z9_9ACTN|nr:phosphatase PAP2 family protein [Tsukamurella asaccharolytica]TWS18816.1 phosphatase PAP2 family protein [Tsukamurella asaccharolytica]
MVTDPNAWPNPVDQGALDWMLAIRSDALTAVMRVITTVGNTASMWVIGIAGFLYLLLLRKERGWAVYCGVTQLFGLGLMVVLKRIFGRERPPLPPRLVVISSESFPSGHALVSMVVLGTFAVAAYALSGRWWPLVAAVAASVVIGMSRVYLAAHWLLDVLAGWAIGATVVAAGLLVLRLRRGRAVLPDRRAGPPAAAG